MYTYKDFKTDSRFTQDLIKSKRTLHPSKTQQIIVAWTSEATQLANSTSKTCES